MAAKKSSTRTAQPPAVMGTAAHAGHAAALPARRPPSRAATAATAAEKAAAAAQKAAAHARAKMQAEKNTLQAVGTVVLASAAASYGANKKPKVFGLDSRLVAGLAGLVGYSYLGGKTKGIVLAGAVGALASYASDVGKGISGDPGSGVGALPDPEVYGADDYGRSRRGSRGGRPARGRPAGGGRPGRGGRPAGGGRPGRGGRGEDTSELKRRLAEAERRAAEAEATAEEAVTALEQADEVAGDYDGELEGELEGELD